MSPDLQAVGPQTNPPKKDTTPTSLTSREELKNFFYSPSNPGSFSSAARLYDNVKKKNQKITLKDVSNWLMQQRTFTIHKPQQKTFKRRKVIKLSVSDTFTADLIDCIALKTYNSNYAYLLCVLDIFCNYAWVRPIKQKTTVEVTEAFESILEESGIVPTLLWTDMGREFTSLKSFYEKYGIKRYSVDSPLKGCKIERWNRVLEERLFKIMTARNSLRYIDFLQEAVAGINASKSRALYGLSPIECLESRDKQKWLRQKYEEEEKNADFEGLKKKKFKIHDKVRVIKARGVFGRGYTAGFEEEVREIEKCLNTSPPTYKVFGLRRSYYEPELSMVKEAPAGEPDRYFFIEKTREVGGKLLRSGRRSGKDKEYLLKNLNDPTVSTWISEPQYQNLKDERLLFGPV